ncbi:sulfate reduction electron transfer complex DsrMKJOP subunit DsrM [Archaeoglobus veneficus]|uniref:Nitrate reductase gamma subunit n=1 Tax=Archaeoglobus veneficus (strain DSM 11195 / SNP6) TaxID=693661 RepID=F2KQF5_ARCVS|nr:sulfate reduction electron transfer complex DsrMKJOP subunit DsrM [Archaeoglobus veneficus]AEA47688.1 Nitrate reductase gamma subunit [Archaeoglobus veneficus SNP6]
MIVPLLEIAVPYVAFAIFLIGVIYRAINWAKSPVPLKIPTTCGQQYTLPFIRRTIYDRFDSPYTKWETIGRMFFEVFFFRSLFRNTRYYYTRHEHRDTRFLWFFAILFHWSFLLVLISHLRFFLEPVPGWLEFYMEVSGLKGAFVPEIYIPGITAFVGLLCLFGRRLFLGKERTISLPSDYLALILLISVIATGLLMRYIIKVPIEPVKELAIGLVTFHPVATDVHPLFLLHLLLACTALAYFPFSKLMHAAGVLFSPTRNMPNDNRARTHVNPWNPPYKGITWQEYYEMYKDQLDEIAEEGYKVRPEV